MDIRLHLGPQSHAYTEMDAYGVPYLVIVESQDDTTGAQIQLTPGVDIARPADITDAELHRAEVLHEAVERWIAELRRCVEEKAATREQRREEVSER